MKILIRLCLSVLLICTSLAQAEVRVIQLQHRMDNEMIPIVQPLLNSWERVAGNGQQLILQAETARLDELQELIASLDTPLRRLLITLDEIVSCITSERGIEIQGRARSRHGEIVVGEHGSQGNHVEIRHYNTSNNDNGLRSVQTLEGNAAYIQTGQQIPQQQWTHDRHGRPVMQTVQRQLTQGLYVTPTIQGNRVTLELNTQNDTLARHNPRIVEQQSVSTRVSGYLNEWIQIGGIDQSSQHSSSGIPSNSKTYSTENKALRIKVQLLDE